VSAPAAFSATEILGTLRKTFPIRIKYRVNQADALVMPNVLEISCQGTTAGVLADYFDEACRRVIQGEDVGDAFISAELPMAVANMKAKEGLNVFCNVITQDHSNIVPISTRAH
jgi:hypothetical protein